MITTIATVCYVLAFVLFQLSAFGISSPRVNLTAAGLACLTLAFLLGV